MNSCRWRTVGSVKKSLASATQYERLLKLDALLRGPGRRAKRDLARSLEVSDKTIQRDFDFLKDRLGAPLEYEREHNCYFYADRSWRLPLFHLSENEMLAYLTIVAAMQLSDKHPQGKIARSVRALADVMAESFSVDPEVLSRQFSIRLPPTRQVDPQIWSDLVLALTQKGTVRLAYRPTSAPASAKPFNVIVDPYHISNMRGEWFVFGFCHRARDIRQYAVARIVNIKRTGEVFELPDKLDVRLMVETGFGGYTKREGESHDFVLVFDAHVADRVKQFHWHPEQQLRSLPDGRVELRFKGPGLEGVKRWVLAWGGQVEVGSPPELKEWLKDEATRITQRYG